MCIYIYIYLHATILQSYHPAFSIKLGCVGVGMILKCSPELGLK